MLGKTSKLINKGDYVWVQSGEKGSHTTPWAGKVLLQQDHKLKVLSDDNEEKWIEDSAVLGPLHIGIIKSVDDMITLNDLQERSLLRNLHIRYKEDKVYTYIGWILIAVNPYKQLPIYTNQDVIKYRGKRIGELPPHIFAIGAQSFANVQQNSQGQCIVISGETGAGKTESAKLLINFLASLTAKNTINQRIIKANPIIEAFGNAKTTKNDNSSRFGKYVEIFFNDNIMESASIQYYLLESSRVKTQNFGDRNYHIFYTMLAGLTQQELKQLNLNPNSRYEYLKNGSVIESEGRNEKEEYKNLINAMETLNFSKEERWEIFKLLAAILHIGNLVYNSVVIDNIDAAEIKPCENLNKIISLLGVVKEDFMEALTHKTIFVEGNKLVTAVSKDQASYNRDGFVMALYGNIFSYILKQINKNISNQMSSGKPEYIGILDIFGFENFTNNSLEQLCINFANEHLQQFFVQQVFKLEQEEYKKEGIEWRDLDYMDNENVLEILGGKTINILSLIDEQTKFPKGSDSGFLVKARQNFSKHVAFINPKSDVSSEFGIKHYAGNVQYKVEGFINKNRNSLNADWVEVVNNCKNEFLKNLFTKELSASNNSKKPTMVIQYKSSLDLLIKTLQSCNPFFIRCIKPNGAKKPGVFNDQLSYQQLQYLGIMDTANIRRAGYPIRHSYFEFVQQFHILLSGTPPAAKINDCKGVTKKICQKVLGHKDYQMGITKIFLKSQHSNILELAKTKLVMKSVVIIQKNIRRFIYRRRYVKIRTAALTIQKHWRARKPRKNYINLRTGYLRLQACIKRRQQHFMYKKMRKSIIRLQARCRGYLARKNKPVKGKTVIKNESTELDNLDFIIDEQFYMEPTKQKLREPLTIKDTIEKGMQDFLDPNVMTFQQFAAANFTGNVSYKYTSKVPTQSLLELESNMDSMAVPALWYTIMRLMGDAPEGSVQTERSSVSIMNQLSDLFSANFKARNAKIAMKLLEEEEKKARDAKLLDGPSNLYNLSLAHRNKLQSEVKRAELHGQSLQSSYLEWINKRTSILEKIHFIIGHGILRPGLRDEIYCQLCKQLTENPGRMSTSNGWFLMTLCTGCFPPSNKLAPTLLNFLAVNGNKIHSFTRLQRTLQNGVRNQPPSYYELNALRTSKATEIDVYLMDDNCIPIVMDSATTASEVCSHICDEIGLRDRVGFSLFITIFGKVISMEAGGCHIMDSICQCEELVKSKGVDEADIPWRIEFRKEMFTPWQSAQNFLDPIANDLVFHQIMRFVRSGQYKCSKEFELCMIMAQYYYITYGKKTVLLDILANMIPEIIPEPLINQKKLSYWCQLTCNTFLKSYYVQFMGSEESVKRDMVQFAKKKWALYLSKYYEVTQISGLHLESATVILAINSEGIYFASNSTEILMKFTYLEIISIDHEYQEEEGRKLLKIVTSQGYIFVFQTEYAEIISDFINWIIKEMKKYSKYTTAISDYVPPDENFLALSKGDLVHLMDGPSHETEWLKGKAMSGEVGEFPSRVVDVLPINNTPTKHLLDRYVKGLEQKPQLAVKKYMLDVKRHTLESYGTIHFKLGNNMSSIRNWRALKSISPTQEVAKYYNAPLSSPLHKNLQQNPWNSQAVLMSKEIFEYMHSRGPRINVKGIFQPALSNEILRDELYCQILKQVTHSPKKEIEKRGLELLWLAAGLFPCTSALLQDLKLFLTTRPKEICQEILYRLEKTLEMGARKRLPHWIEVEAIQQSLPITHRICFSNDMEHLFEIESSTKVGELVDKIIGWLGLQKTVGFSLIINMDNNKTMPMSHNEFIFDVLQTIFNDKLIPEFKSKTNHYDIVFVRKLWLDTLPEQDIKADIVCHYPQEVAKYLNGEHNCTHFDAICLASYILLAQKDVNEEINTNIDQVIEIQLKNNGLIPKAIREEKDDDYNWINPIKMAYRKNAGTRSVDAQVAFLKYIVKWPTYGCSFFEVREAFSQNKRVIKLAISKDGILVKDPITREILKKIYYKEIQDCSFRSDMFIIKTDHGEYSWITDVGYKIADLVNSYLTVTKDYVSYYGGIVM